MLQDPSQPRGVRVEVNANLALQAGCGVGVDVFTGVMIFAEALAHEVEQNHHLPSMLCVLLSFRSLSDGVYVPSSTSIQEATSCLVVSGGIL